MSPPGSALGSRRSRRLRELACWYPRNRYLQLPHRSHSAGVTDPKRLAVEASAHDSIGVDELVPGWFHVSDVVLFSLSALKSRLLSIQAYLPCSPHT